MSDSPHYDTAPQDRIPLQHKLIYGLGAFVNNLLSAAISGLLIVLNLGLGINPAIVGLIGSLPRLTDALTDPLMGYISDNTRSRWGRRRPYIFVGAILSGITFALLWQLPVDKSESFYFWYILGGSLIFYLAYTMFATPWVALGYELTPDYNERTRLMGVQNFIGQFAWLLAPWFLFFMQSKDLFDNMIDGASWLAIIIAVVVVVVGILPAIFLKERFNDLATEEHNKKEAHEKAIIEEAETKESLLTVFKRNTLDFFHGFATTLKFKPFQKLCGATFLVFNGFMLVSSFQFYVIIYYIFGGDMEAGSKYAGYSGTILAIATLGVIAFITWLGTKIGKRRAFFVSTGASMIGYALKWVCYTPETPWLMFIPAPFIAFGLGGLFTLMASMVADVVDLDELNTHERREGMYGSIFWWVVKLGYAAAIAAGGFLLNFTGFDVALGGNQAESTIFMMRLFDVIVPFVSSGIAIWLIYSFTITEDKAHQIRLELEQRRGAV